MKNSENSNLLNTEQNDSSSSSSVFKENISSKNNIVRIRPESRLEIYKKKKYISKEKRSQSKIIINKNFKNNNDILGSEFHLDFSGIKNIQGIDSTQDSSKIPERLNNIIDVKKNSLVYLALLGENIIGYNEQKIQKTLIILKSYLKICINKGFIYESNFLSKIIKNINNSLNENKINKESINIENSSLI